MAAADNKDDKAESTSGASGGMGSKLVLILSAVNIIATVAIIAMLFISFQKEKKKSAVEDIAVNSGAAEHGAAGGEHGGGKEGEGGGKETAKAKSNYGKMITLEQFTVNLATPGSVNPKFVRVNMSLEVPSDDTESEVTVKMPQVRNVVIDLFNSKRPTDLATAEGRDYIKEEIKTAINAFLVTGKVKGVFFTNFAVSN